MTKKPDKRKEPAGYPPQSELVGALADVLEDQKAKAKARKEVKAPRSARSGPFKAGVLLVLSVISAYLWFGSPPWLSTEGDNPVSPELQEAGAKMELYLHAIRIEEFWSREGRLPSSLAEIGEPESQVQFDRTGQNGYRLAIAGPQGIISYMSSDSLDLLLGNTLEVIGGAG